MAAKLVAIRAKQFTRSVSALHARNPNPIAVALESDAPGLVCQHEAQLAAFDAAIRMRLRPQPKHVFHSGANTSFPKLDEVELLGRERRVLDAILGQRVDRRL